MYGSYKFRWGMLSLTAIYNMESVYLSDKISMASFGDKKIGVIKVACISSYFNSKQCAKLLALFSFDNDKLEALKVLAPRIVDFNPKEIVKQFTFSSNKDKALDILSER